MNIDLLRQSLSEDYQGGGISLVRKGYSEDYQLVIDQILASTATGDYIAVFDSSANKWKIILVSAFSTFPGDVTFDEDIIMYSGKTIGITTDLDLITLTADTVTVAGVTSVGSDEIVKTATAVLTAQECRGTLISNLGQGAAATYTLPTAEEGLNITFTCAVTENVHLKAGASDKIYLDGTALDNADKVSNTAAAVSHNITLWTLETSAGVYDWIAASGLGPWLDGGA